MLPSTIRLWVWRAVAERLILRMELLLRVRVLLVLDDGQRSDEGLLANRDPGCSYNNDRVCSRSSPDECLASCTKHSDAVHMNVILSFMPACCNNDQNNIIMAAQIRWTSSRWIILPQQKSTPFPRLSSQRQHKNILPISRHHHQVTIERYPKPPFLTTESSQQPHPITRLPAAQLSSSHHFPSHQQHKPPQPPPHSSN
jgi:hypothetical protein